MYCEVYLLDAPYHIDRPFDYFSAIELTVGDLVRVPFGRANHTRLGVVVRLKESTDGDGIKAVSSRVGFTLDSEMPNLCGKAASGHRKVKVEKLS